MIPTHFLFHLAEYEGIRVEWHDFKEIDGLYINSPSLTAPIITLSNTLRTRERDLRCVLSHELGHHYETVGHHMIAATGTNSIYATKNEIAATKWAVDLLIPTDVFLECVEDGMGGQELCNYFYVLPEYIIRKAELLHKDTSLTDTIAELKTNYNVYF